MTRPTSTGTRGRPVLAVLAVGWVVIGSWAIEDGDLWRAATAVAIGVLMGSTYWWPDSVVARLTAKPIFDRRKDSAPLDAPGPG